jgi:antitoxin component YwqK of YwqJK toxin-antitoxin module
MKKSFIRFVFIAILAVLLPRCLEVTEAMRLVTQTDERIKNVERKVNPIDSTISETYTYFGRIGKYKSVFDKHGVLLCHGPVEDGEWNGVVNFYNENAFRVRSVSFKNGIRNGVEIEYFEDGRVKCQFEYLNGLYHGICTCYFPDGVPFWRGEFVRGELHGTYYERYKDGTTEIEAWVQNDSLLYFNLYDTLGIKIDSLGPQNWKEIYFN